MGTTCMYDKPHNVKEYLSGLFTGQWGNRTHRVLQMKIVNLNEAYVAWEMVDDETGERRVLGCVVKLTYSRGDRLPFCYKEIDEDMGPYYDNCPESILDLLTPTDNEYANDWRERCRATIAKRKESLKRIRTIRKANKRGRGGLFEVAFPDGKTYTTTSHNRARTWAWWAECRTPVEATAA